jgi:prephenate dehydrogenase
LIVGVVGLGLMGGSFAISLRKRCKKEFIIIGSDHNQNHIKEALDLSIIDEAQQYETLIKISDIIIFAIPVKSIIAYFKNLKNLKKDALIIDLGSTKESIINSIPPKYRKNLVATHPMAGTEYSGPNAAFDGLYKDKITVFCNIEQSGKNQLELATKIFNAVGSKIVYMNAKEHDRHAAFISHMPHIVSFSLSNSVLAQEDKKNILLLAAGGFKDMSRLAKSSPYMWKDIFNQNKKSLLNSMDFFEKELNNAKNMIINDEWDKLVEWMKKANRLHELF